MVVYGRQFDIILEFIGSTVSVKYLNNPEN